jgi:hypothetical protein
MAALILLKSTLTKDLPWFVIAAAAIGVAAATFYVARVHLVHEIRRRIVATFDECVPAPCTRHVTKR